MHDESLTNVASWDQDELVLGHCARMLRRGQFVIVLGAGASIAFGLPNWGELVDRVAIAVARELDCDPIAHSDPVLRSHLILQRQLNMDELELSRYVGEALYPDNPHSLGKLNDIPLISALGAFLLRLQRASRPIVVSYNYDDLLETYLEYFGVRTQSVYEVPSMLDAADATVYHVHGLLKHRSPRDVRRPVVLTRDQLLELKKSLAQSHWGDVLRSVLLSRFALFIGLSGDDPNFDDLLSDIKKRHPSGTAFWGLRFAKKNDPKLGDWEQWGVRNLLVDDWSQVPDWLLKVIQRSVTSV